MKVLVISSKYPPEYSGSGLRAHNTYLRLSRQYDITFEVICSSLEFTKSKEYLIDEVSVTRIVSSLLRKTHHHIGPGRLRSITNAAVFYIEARAVTKLLARKQFDVIHVFGYSPATVAAINWTRKKSIPLILEIVNKGISPYQYLPGTSKFYPYDLTQQSVIVAISKYLAEVCKSEGLNDNVWTRPNPVDTSRFKLNSKNQRANTIVDVFGFKQTDRIIVYVAKFMKQKNHEFLIEVMKYLPDTYKLILAGPTTTAGEVNPGIKTEQIPELQSHIGKIGLAERIKIIPGFVDTAKYLSGADVFCFPAENEAMGTPLLESLASGVPVVANADESSFREHIVDGNNGFLHPLNPRRWANAIIKAANLNLEQRQQFAKETATKYSTDKIDNDYFKLITALKKSKKHDQISVDGVLNS